MTPAPDNFMHQTGSLTTQKLYENLHVHSYKTPIKKAQPNFLQTSGKPEIIFNSFYHGFDNQFFSAFIDKLSECRIL